MSNAIHQEPDHLLSVAERAVELAVGRGADEAEAYVDAGHDVSVEIEDGRLACVTTSGEHGIGLRLLQHGKAGFASASALDAPGRVVDAALRMAGAAPQRDFSLVRPDPQPQAPDAWDRKLASYGPEDAMGMARSMLEAWQEGAAGTTFTGGAIGISQGSVAIANSHGVRAADRQTRWSAMASLVDEDGGINAWRSDSSHHEDGDAAAVVRDAGRTVRELRGPTEAPWTGDVPVLFSPTAAAELFADFIVGAATGDDAKRGNTPWSDAVGTPVATAALSVFDDPLDPAAVGVTAFDDEGSPTRRLPILQGGVLTGFLYDAWDAARHGATTTGSAVRAGSGGRPRTGTHHLRFEVSGARPLPDLIAGIDRGYYVESVLGAHTANQTTGAFSITAPNVWRIEKGAVAGSCEAIALAGTVPALLENIVGSSVEKKRMSGQAIGHLLCQGLHISR